MGALENAKAWLADEASSQQRAAIERRLNPEDGLIAAINAVTVTGPQLKAAYELIQHIPVRSQADAIEQAHVMRGFANDYGFTPADYAGPALHMRIVAMDRWCRAHDPRGETNPAAFFEAAGRQPLIQTETGMAFEPESFAELIQFITDLPF